MINEAERAVIAHTLSCSAVGSAETVERELRSFVERTEADELRIVGQIHDHAARLRSYEIAAQVMGKLKE